MQNLINLPIHDFVVPIGTVRDGKFEIEGTGFLIGACGFLLTAGHVAEALARKGTPVAVFRPDGKWNAVEIVASEVHPDEDVAILQLPEWAWHSIHSISAAPEFSSSEIMLWGYPESVAKELQRLATNEEEAQIIRPDLIYFQGYIRRRYSGELPVSVLRGRSFYEISEVAGSCCSGAPMTVRAPGRAFSVVGIYIGEETGSRRGAGYAVRSDAFANWTPALLDRAVGAEQPTDK